MSCKEISTALKDRWPFLAIVAVTVIALAIEGCGTKTIVQRPNTAGVIAQPIKGAHVLLPDSNGNLVEQTVDIQPGDEVKFTVQKGK